MEIIHWEGTEPNSEEKVMVLRHAIKDYDKDWELIQIGAPDEDKIPLMFQKKVLLNKVA